MAKSDQIIDVIRLVLFHPRMILSTKYDTPLQNLRYRRAAELYTQGEDVLVSLLVEEVLEKRGKGVPSVQLASLHEGKRGSLRPYEMKVLATLVKAFQPNTFLEIGTFEGRTTQNIALNMPKNSHLYTMDLPQGPSYEVGVFHKQQSFPAKVHQIYANSFTYDFSQIPLLDMAFIDGAHGYQAVYDDSKNVMRRMKSGGIIVWDDIDQCHLGSTQAAITACEEEGYMLSLLSGTKMAIAWKE